MDDNPLDKANGTSRDEKRRRIQEVANQILEGYSTTDIIEYGTKTWDVQVATIRAYITVARRAIRTDYSGDRKRRVSFAVKQRNRLFNRAMAMGDLGNALAAIKDVSKLRGDYPTEGESRMEDRNDQEETSVRSDVIDLTPEQIAARWKDLV